MFQVFDLPGDVFSEAFKAKASYTIPVVLHTNKESRAVAQKHFSLAFGSQLGGNPVSSIHFSIDIHHEKCSLMLLGFHSMLTNGPCRYISTLTKM